MKKQKFVYWITTGLFSAMMLLSAGMYILDYTNVKTVFIALGYPPHIIYPLALAKILGLVTVWGKFSQKLKEWAYAGFFFDLILAAAAHLAIQDNGFAPSLVALTLLLTSYYFDHKLFGPVPKVS